MSVWVIFVDHQQHTRDFSLWLIKLACEFDYIIAMDADNLRNLRNMCPPGAKAKLQLLLDYSRKPEYDVVSEVPDPYYGGEDGFPHVLDLIEDASVALLDHIKAEIVVASESQA